MFKTSIIVDESYHQWISDLSDRYQRSQIKAATAVNSEMLRFYWSLGRDVMTMRAESKWGSGFIKQLSDKAIELGHTACPAGCQRLFQNQSAVYDSNQSPLSRE